MILIKAAEDLRVLYQVTPKLRSVASQDYLISMSVFVYVLA